MLLLKELTPHSGHYRPSDEDFARCIQTFADAGVDMSGVKIAEPKKRKEKNLCVYWPCRYHSCGTSGGVTDLLRDGLRTCVDAAVTLARALMSPVRVRSGAVLAKAESDRLLVSS